MFSIKKIIKKIVERILFSRAGIPITLLFYIYKTSGLSRQKSYKNQYNVLALNPDRFRGDLEILNNTKNFKIITLPFNLQAWMINSFYIYPKSILEFYNPSENSDIYTSRIKCRNYLKLFLKYYYKILKIDCVLGAAVHYKHDYDWGAVSHELGVPYIVLHRENLLQLTVGGYKYVYQLSKLIGEFQGTAIVVHNKRAADCFVDSKFADAHQVYSLGCLRMDSYLKRVKNSVATRKDSRRKCTFFSFSPGNLLLFPEMANGGFKQWPAEKSLGMYDFFDNSIIAIGQLAIENPEIDFVIKPKWGGDWVDKVKQSLSTGGVLTEELDNLFILSDADAHDLIIESTVVCGFASTILLEAAVAKKPVVMPLFDEAKKLEFRDYILLKDYKEEFNISYSVEDFKQTILRKLKLPNIKESGFNKSKSLFNKYVSHINESATEKYENLIISRINESKK